MCGSAARTDLCGGAPGNRCPYRDWRGTVWRTGMVLRMCNVLDRVREMARPVSFPIGP